MMRVSGEMGGGGSHEAEKSPEEIMDIVELAGEEAQRKAFKMAYPDQEFNLASIYNGDYDDNVIKNIYEKLREMSAEQSAGSEGGSAGSEGGSAGSEGGSAGEAPGQGGGSAEGEPAQAAPAEGNSGHGETRGGAQRSKTLGSKLLRAAMIAAGAGLLLGGSGVAVHNAMNAGATVAGAGEAIGDEADTSSEDDASVVSEAMGAAAEGVQDAADSIAENAKAGAEDEDSAEKEAMEFWLGHYAGHYAGEDGTGTNPDKLKSVNIDKPLEYETLDEATDLLVEQLEDQPASLAVTSFCLLHELGAEGVDEKGMNGVLEDLENDGLHKDLLAIITNAMKEAAQDKDKERVRKVRLPDGQYANVYFTDTADGGQVTSENIVINHCVTHENGTPAIAYDIVLDRDEVVSILEKRGIKFEDSAGGGKVEFTLIFKEECRQLVIKMDDGRVYEVVVSTTPELPEEKKKELEPKQPVPNQEEELESKNKFDEYTTLDESAHAAGDENYTKGWDQNVTGDGSAQVAATDHDTTEDMEGAGGTGVGEQETAQAPKSKEAQQANEEFGDQGGEDDDSDSDSEWSDDGGDESSGGGGSESSGGGGGESSGGGGSESSGGGGGESSGGGGGSSDDGGSESFGGGGGDSGGGGSESSGGGEAVQNNADNAEGEAQRAVESQPDVQDLSGMSMDDI